MPISAAAMAGIEDNGLAWKRQINLHGLTGGLAEDDLPEAAIDVIRKGIVNRVQAFAERLPSDDPAREALTEAVNELRGAAPEIDEVRWALDRLYDEFDYYRICVVG